MKEIRLHGRGGMGTVTAAEMLATIFMYEGLYAVCLPIFGSERRGAPVSAFLRFDKRPIRIKTRVYHPDCLVIMDPGMFNDPAVYDGLQSRGILILNHGTIPGAGLPENVSKMGVVDATEIAMKNIHRPVPNTCMIGAIEGTTGWFSMESVKAALSDFFGGEQAKRNHACAQAGFEKVKVIQAS